MHKSTEISAGAVQPKQEFLSRELRLFDRYEMQGVLVEALEKTEHHRHLAEKVMGCHKKFRKRTCDQNHTWARAQNSCACRLCPHCSHRRAVIVGQRIQALAVGKADLRYVVLAERSCKNLKAGLDSLFRAWDSLRRSVAWKRKVRGAVVVLEVTRNKRRRTWHPHLNVLIEGEYFPFAELNQLWGKATKGKGRTSRISKADSGTVRELVKYTLKVAERDANGDLQLILDEHAVVDEYLAAVYGVRLVRSYGTFRGLKVADEEAPEEECPDCGSKCIVDSGRVNHSQLTFDFQKEVFRVTSGATEKDRALHLVRYSSPPMLSPTPETIAIAVEGRRRRARYERAVCELFTQNAGRDAA